MGSNQKGAIAMIAVVCLLLQVFLAPGAVAYAGVSKQADRQIAAQLRTIQSGQPQINDAAGNKRKAAGLLLEDYIASKLKARAEYIDITSYNIKVDADNVVQVLNAAEAAVNDHPELFYVGTDCKLSYGMGKVKGLSIEYSMSSAEAAKAEKSFQKETKRALSVVTEEMNDGQKALAIYDYLALSGQYDRRYDNGQAPDISFRAYGILVNKVGVCQAYALAYKYLLNQLGIKCGYVSSPAMDHVWNVVSIDNKNYQVDVTWGDMGKDGKDVLGFVDHKYFLIDEKAMAADHKGVENWKYSAGFSPNRDGPYAPYAFWQSIKSGIYLIDGDYYYVKDNCLKKGNGQSDDKILEEQVLSLAYSQGTLYYAVPTEIYALDHENGTSKAILTGNQISDFGVINDTGWFSTPAGKQYAVAIGGRLPVMFSAQLDSVTSQRGNSATITWGPVPFASGYEIYRKVEGASEYSRVAKVGNQTNYKDTKLAGGITYSYGVKAVGTLFGGKNFSGPLSYPKAVAVPLSAPALKVSNEALQSVSLKWNAVKGAAGYKLYWSKSPSRNYKHIMTIKKGNTVNATYKNAKMIPGDTYYYKIKAYGVKSGRVRSGQTSAAIEARSIPQRPSVRVSLQSSSIMKVEWNQISGATGYEVYRAQESGKVYFKMKSRYGDTMTTFKNTGVKKGETYYYKVRAYKKVNSKKIYGNFSTVKIKKL